MDKDYSQYIKACDDVIECSKYLSMQYRDLKRIIKDLDVAKSKGKDVEKIWNSKAGKDITGLTDLIVKYSATLKESYNVLKMF